MLRVCWQAEQDTKGRRWSFCLLVWEALPPWTRLHHKSAACIINQPVIQPGGRLQCLCGWSWLTGFMCVYCTCVSVFYLVPSSQHSGCLGVWLWLCDHWFVCNVVNSTQNLSVLGLLYYRNFLEMLSCTPRFYLKWDSGKDTIKKCLPSCCYAPLRLL